MGALPELFAATVPDLAGGTYVGPGGLMETRGHPTVVSSRGRSHDSAVAAGLWDLSSRLTGVTFPVG
jgi:hypothetical protein